MVRFQRNKAFTLIELLVVIAVIAVLMAILMPSLRLAKQQAAAMNCMANMRNLSAAWFMYMGDNNDRIVSARMGGQESDGAMVGWIDTPRNVNGQVMTYNQVNPPVEDEDEIRGIERGRLYPYVKEAGVFHCPADNIRRSIYDQTRVFVSYTVPSCLYGETRSSGALYNKQIRRFSSIRRPAEKYNFVESAETRNFNMAGWFSFGAPEHTGSDQWQWWSPMAVNHGNASTLGFCDGHAEKHKWRDPYTIERVDKILKDGVAMYGTDTPPSGQTTDIDYMARGWPYRHKR